MITTIVIIICEETSKTMWISPARWGSGLASSRRLELMPQVRGQLPTLN